MGNKESNRMKICLSRKFLNKMARVGLFVRGMASAGRPRADNNKRHDKLWTNALGAKVADSCITYYQFILQNVFFTDEMLQLVDSKTTEITQHLTELQKLDAEKLEDAQVAEKLEAAQLSFSKKHFNDDAATVDTLTKLRAFLRAVNEAEENEFTPVTFCMLMHKHDLVDKFRDGPTLAFLRSGSAHSCFIEGMANPSTEEAISPDGFQMSTLLDNVIKNPLISADADWEEMYPATDCGHHEQLVEFATAEPEDVDDIEQDESQCPMHIGALAEDVAQSEADSDESDDLDDMEQNEAKRIKWTMRLLERGHE